MKNVERIILFYFVGLLLFALVLLAFGQPLVDIFRIGFFWWLPAIFSILGFLLGGAVFALMMKPAKKRNRIFVWSHSVGLLLFLIPFSILTYIHQEPKSPFPNRDANHTFINDFLPDTTSHIRRAFNKLESSFLSPNDFKLRSFSARQRDTVVNGLIDSVSSVYFEYQINDKADRAYLSKIDVFGDASHLLLFNADPSANEEYQVWKRQHAETLNNNIQNAKEALEKIRKEEDQ